MGACPELKKVKFGQLVISKVDTHWPDVSSNV